MIHVYFGKADRRTALKALVGAIAGIGLGRRAFAEALPHLTDANPAAASLEYTEDASTVDERKFPQHKPEQRCANCAPCRLYPGNAVNAKGWCAGYVAK